MAKMNVAVGSLRKTVDGKMWSPKALALTAASFAAAFLPLAGIYASWAVDLYRNGEVAKDQKKVLADYYRNQIAAQLGIDPKSVGHRELDLAAKTNPAFAKLVHKIELEKERSDRTSHMSTAAGAVVSGGGILPTAGFAKVTTDATTKAIVEGGSQVAGGLASMIFNKDKLCVQDVVSVIDEKTAQGASIEAMDVMLLRIAQDDGLQEEIQKQFKKPLHQMNEVEQRSVLAAMPDLYQLADRDAQAVNAGRIKHQDLIMTSPGQQQQAFGQFTARHASRGGRQGSWTQQVNAQRTAAPTQGRVV
ncbi:MAG: hypothetical protein ACOYJ2_00690 [Rickettsiales bacterium]